MKPQEPVKGLKPRIPARAVTKEAIVDGLIVRLGPGEVFWKLDSGTFELNAFTGNIAAKVVRRYLTERDIHCILNGIRSGRLMVTETLTKGKPVNTAWLTSEYAPRARRLLDHPDQQFSEALKRTYSLTVLETALAIEKEEKNRKDRVALLTAKIVTMKQG